MVLQPVIKLRIADKRHFDGLNQAATFFAIRKGVQKREIIHNGMRDSKGADPVFFAEIIHTILNAHSAITFTFCGSLPAFITIARNCGSDTS